MPLPLERAWGLPVGNNRGRTAYGIRQMQGQMPYQQKPRIPPRFRTHPGDGSRHRGRLDALRTALVGRVQQRILHCLVVPQPLLQVLVHQHLGESAPTALLQQHKTHTQGRDIDGLYHRG